MNQSTQGGHSMRSFVFEIGERSRKVSRLIGKLRSDLQKAFVIEKKSQKLTQQAIATRLNVNRSVINRQLTGTENLTVKSAVELAWAMGWETRIEVFKPELVPGKNELNSGLRETRVRASAGTGTSYRPLLPIANTQQIIVLNHETVNVTVRAE
jgi:transcriptional regulator with XRE-family HTH domain